MSDKKILVAYFSCTGVTARAAQKLAEAAQADLYEIKPEQPYTQADLNWSNKKSRSSLEMNDPTSRPAISGKVENMEQYDTVFVGFPIWWYVAPTIINTFLESYDFSGKTVIPFCSHGGGRFGQSLTAITKLIPEASMGEALSIHYSGGSDMPDDVSEWLSDNGIAIN